MTASPVVSILSLHCNSQMNVSSLGLDPKLQILPDSTPPPFSVSNSAHPKANSWLFPQKTCFLHHLPHLLMATSSFLLLRPTPGAMSWIPSPNVSANSKSYWLYLEMCPGSHRSPSLLWSSAVVSCLEMAVGSSLVCLPLLTPLLSILSKAARMTPLKQETGHVVLCSESSLPCHLRHHLRAFAHAVTLRLDALFLYRSTWLSLSSPLSFCSHVTFPVRPSP